MAAGRPGSWRDDGGRVQKGMATHSSGLYQVLYPCLENPTDRGACEVTVRGVIRSWTHLK